MNDTQIQSTADKIRGLLAKARNTPYPEEANLFLAKASEMMAKHSISEAMLADKRTDEINELVISVGKYHVQKCTVLVGVVKAFGCHAVSLSSRGRGVYGIVGFQSDLDMVQALMESLGFQLDRELLTVKGTYGIPTKSARVSFAHEWSRTVSDRIAAFYDSAVEEAVAESSSTALVLVSRDEKVADAYTERYNVKPRYYTRSTNHNHYGSYGRQGAEAGQRADIGAKRMDGNRGALTA
jgi:hypothetical protein